MNHDDIIRMAREAHRQLVTQDYPGHAGQLDPWTMRLLERFAVLVAAHEREECAKLADRTLCACLTGYFVDPIGIWGTQVAIDIRKRGQA